MSAPEFDALAGRIARDGLAHLVNTVNWSELAEDAREQIPVAMKDLSVLSLRRAAAPTPAQLHGWRKQLERLEELRRLEPGLTTEADLTELKRLDAEEMELRERLEDGEAEVFAIERELAHVDAQLASWKFRGANSVRRSVYAAAAHAANLVGEAVGAFVNRLVRL